MTEIHILPAESPKDPKLNKNANLYEKTVKFKAFDEIFTTVTFIKKKTT
jgi:hypothetical protein